MGTGKEKMADEKNAYPDFSSHPHCPPGLSKSAPLHGAVYRLGLPVHHGEALNLEDMTAAAE